MMEVTRAPDKAISFTSEADISSLDEEKQQGSDKRELEGVLTSGNGFGELAINLERDVEKQQTPSQRQDEPDSTSKVRSMSSCHGERWTYPFLVGKSSGLGGPE
jgi:hypothetical protein